MVIAGQLTESIYAVACSRRTKVSTATTIQALHSTTETCTIKMPSRDLLVSAAKQAVTINPANSPTTGTLLPAAADTVIPPQHIALLTKKYWGKSGVKLTVAFMDNPPADLRAKLLSHMNAWGAWGNVTFTETSGQAQVRIARTAGQGYWSYLGTDILSIAQDQPTMNLDSFTMNTADSEFFRVVRHETGHTLGFPHEHMRSEIVNRIDREKAISYFMADQGWSRDQVIAQVLTPLDNSALIETAHADARSIMCYWLPGSIMKDGVAVTGGTDIDMMDAEFAASVYPRQGWSPWVAHGAPPGGFNGAPAAISRNSTVANIYVRGNDNALWQKAWISDSWQDWGRHNDGVLASKPAVGTMGPDHEHVFVRGSDNNVWQKWWTKAQGWSAWVALGAPPGGINGAPAVVSRNNAVCNLYVRGNDNALWQKAWFDNKWHDWGRHNDGGVLASDPAVGTMGPDHEHVFVRGSDNNVWQKWWTKAQGWSAWVALGAPPGGFNGAPSIVSRNNAVCNIYVRGNDNALWQKAWFNNSWHNWDRHNDGGVLASEPALSAMTSNNEDVFVRGTDNGVWEKWWNG